MSDCIHVRKTGYQNFGKQLKIAFETRDFCINLGPKLVEIRLRACSHEPGTVNYPWVMTAPGQALPRVHMMICCPGAMLPQGKFIVI